MRLKDRVAIITGGSRGIGYAIAKAFLGEGAKIVISATNEKRLKDAADALSSLGEIKYRVSNVADINSVKKLVDFTIKEFGRLDILVNNAGITRDNILLRMKDSEWKDVIDINLTGVFNCSKACLKHIMKNRGSIINITSVVGIMGNAGQCNYAASKAGVIGFTKSLAREIARKGARVNAIAPGFIITDMTDALSNNIKEELKKGIPLNRFGNVDEVARVAIFLASEDASYITGQVISVDGGLYM